MKLATLCALVGLLAVIVMYPVVAVTVLRPEQLQLPERTWVPDPPPDEAVWKVDRYGRTLMACRQLRKDELRLAGHEADGIEYWNQVGAVFETIVTLNAQGASRTLQADRLQAAVGDCAKGTSIEAEFGVKVPALSIDYAGVQMEVLMEQAEKKMAGKK